MVGLLSNPILRTEDALCSIEDVMHSKGMRISSVKPDVQEYDREPFDQRICARSCLSSSLHIHT